MGRLFRLMGDSILSAALTAMARARLWARRLVRALSASASDTLWGLEMARTSARWKAVMWVLAWAIAWGTETVED